MDNQKLILIFVFLVLYSHKSTDSFMYNFSNLQLKILILFILFFVHACLSDHVWRSEDNFLYFHLDPESESLFRLWLAAHKLLGDCPLHLTRGVLS